MLEYWGTREMPKAKAQMPNEILMSNNKREASILLLDLGFWHSLDIWILALGFVPVVQDFKTDDCAIPSWWKFSMIKHKRRCLWER